MSCENVLFIKFGECDNSFTFPIALVPNTDYAYLLTDKFGNKYKDTFTSNSDGSLTINKSDFQDFTFTSASGNFTLSIKEHINSCNNINFVYCDAEFESITFSFSKNHLNLMPTCEIIRTCLGISDNGSESSFLNEKGEFKTYQEILSNLPSYSIQQDAIDDGNPNGFWYYNTTTKSISKIGVEITSYTAGTSTIDFTNNGGDDWNIDFKITPDTVQSTANIVGYQYRVDFWNGGVNTLLSGGFKTTDFTFNTAGNGSGVYEISQLYIFDDSSTFYIYSLFKVNASGTVIAYVKMQGITVNSTSGIDINATANVSQYGVSYPLQWISFDTFPPTVFNPIGNTTTINVALPIDAIGVGCIAVLDSVFTNDITDNNGMAISLIIS